MPIPGPSNAPKIISLTGDPGSGKSTVRTILVERWGVAYHYAGAVFRDLVAKRGMTLDEFNAKGSDDLSIDREVDAVFKDLAKTDQDLIVEGRTAWHILPQSFKIKLTVSCEQAAQRIYRDKTRRSEKVDSPEIILQSLRLRIAADAGRYRALYGFDLENDANFNLIIDTANVTPEEVANLIDRLSPRFFSGEHTELKWIAPRSLYPSAETKVTGSGLELPPDEFDQTPVLAVDYDRHYLIIDGHTRTSRAIMAGVPFIPVRTIKPNEDVFGKHMTGVQFFKSHLNPDFIHEWEDVHGFKFPLIPSVS